MSTSDKLLSVLALFSIEEAEWSVDEAAKRLGLPVSTTYRYFRSLTEAGLIVAFAAGRYVVGPAIVQLDRQTRLLDPLLKTATPKMQSLAQASNTPSIFLLCRLYRNQVMCVHQEHADRPEYAVSYERGRLMPLHRGASSKIILAYLPSRFVRTFYSDHKEDLEAVGLGKDWKEVKSSLRSIRSAGICITYAELDANVIGIAAPIFDPEGGVIGSLALVLGNNGNNGEILKAASKTIRVAAASISDDLAGLAASKSRGASVRSIGSV